MIIEEISKDSYRTQESIVEIIPGLLGTSLNGKDNTVLGTAHLCHLVHVTFASICDVLLLEPSVDNNQQ